jgi:hypothetical protein
MKAHPLVVTIVTACTSSTVPPNHPVATVADHADPIACPEARLHALAAHFPDAELEIKTERKNSESRGVVERPCATRETDDACLARARHQIPAGFVALVFDNGAGFVDGAEAWEVTFELDGQIQTKRFPEPDVVEVYELIGHRVKLISQRRVPTPEERNAVVAYGYQRPHREARLAFPPGRALELERIDALERELHLHDDGNWGDPQTLTDLDSDLRWHIAFSCE